MNVLEVRDVAKRYTIANSARQRYNTLSERLDLRRLLRKKESAPAKKDFFALRDISFAVRPGERIGIIGRNGAGKSTLLKLISRITEPTSGLIGLNGRVASLLEVGTGFHPELTGRENIFLNGTILGMRQTEIREKFDQIVEFSGIQEFIDTPVKRYSSGMYVRLAFAVAAHLDSEILIIDEVLAVGDAAFQKKCLGKMDEVSRSGRTILFVSHNLATVQTMCERSLYLKDGEVVFDGPTSVAIQTYLKDVQNEYHGLGVFDIRTMRRAGNGDVLFETVTLKALSKEPDIAEAMRTGDDLFIGLTLGCVRPVRDANVAIIIYDRFGTRIIDANLAIRGESASFDTGQTRTINFTLRDVLLRPGEYVLGLFCGIPNTDIDVILEAITFRVEERLSAKKYSVTFDGFYQCNFETEISG